MKAQELFEKITDRIIADIEAGAGEWRMPWTKIAESGIPQSAVGRPYRGINAFWLSLLTLDHGWSMPVFATYNQWKGLDAQVRKATEVGHGTQVILWKPGKKRDKDTGEEKDSLFATTYTVFNIDQVEGPGADKIRVKHLEGLAKLDSTERIADAEAYFAAVGVEVVEGGNRAYYDRAADKVHVPSIDQFEHAAHYYGTLAHETVHWSGAESRLDRTFGKRFGDEAYAVEELTAELGAAFFCAQAGLSATTRPDHSAYLSHWLKVLRQDPRALSTISSKAQAAVDFLNQQANHEEVAA